ncbi:hypothetical protein GWO43_26820 [candidate division KSB1 bacterium]|nr:hypothetical protein [candidate division KSB1 bacterium]NIR70172.1 hypothetical protein [candidate division KSB1 bacterium]NIS27558.1 hypothetical protein [candidate division KSB1 bacterium]NIT74411.1 hypothetical protein [candidate division KSB1 bacterium]NIU28276.1 hypothetical protein [candidate division KSB1 bacterium]
MSQEYRVRPQQCAPGNAHVRSAAFRLRQSCDVEQVAAADSRRQSNSQWLTLRELSGSSNEERRFAEITGLNPPTILMVLFMSASVRTLYLSFISDFRLDSPENNQ